MMRTLATPATAGYERIGDTYYEVLRCWLRPEVWLCGDTSTARHNAYFCAIEMELPGRNFLLCTNMSDAAAGCIERQLEMSFPCCEAANSQWYNGAELFVRYNCERNNWRCIGWRLIRDDGAPVRDGRGTYIFDTPQEMLLR